MGQSGFELYFDINFEMRDGRGICTGEISVRFGSAVFIREWRRLFEKIGIGKILTCMGFEPGTVGI